MVVTSPISTPNAMEPKDAIDIAAKNPNTPVITVININGVNGFNSTINLFII